MQAKLGYLCSSDSWGGLEMNHVKNAKWMQERGHDVVFFCYENSPIALKAQSEQIDCIYIQKHKKYYDFSAAKALRKLIEKNAVSHLLIRSTFDMSIAANVKYKLKNKIHLSYFMEMQFGVKKTNLLHTLRFKYLDLWSCPLHFLENQVKTMTKFPHQKIKVIPSAINLNDFESPMTKNEARNLLELPENQLIFGLIGRFDPQKGQLLLLEAMKLAKNKDFKIALLGEPTKNEGLEFFEKMNHFISENKLDERVFIRPFRNDIITFYKAIDWFVMASKAETFGMVTIEAMASGTPTLGSNAGGTPEILEKGKIGKLFETLNAQDLANKIDEIIDERMKFSPEFLILKAQQYSHHLVCELVEENLDLHSIEI